jgi:hypothetical protein
MFGMFGLLTISTCVHEGDMLHYVILIFRTYSIINESTSSSLWMESLVVYVVSVHAR